MTLPHSPLDLRPPAWPHEDRYDGPVTPHMDQSYVPHQQRAPRRLWLHVLLFGLTFISAMASQIMPLIPARTGWDLLTIPLHNPSLLWPGFIFAITLMGILLAHEMGHYVTARYYGVDQSLPYFIPAPTLFGTLGAVILMRTQPQNRRMLLNVAVMGPYAGLILAIPAAAWGLAHSVAVDVTTLPGEGVWFGSSLLFYALEQMFSPNGSDVILHPVGLAGWAGMFVTSLNLIPVAQLDGGHVAYALFGKHQEKISRAITAGLLLLGLMIVKMGRAEGSGASGGELWIFWALVLFVVGLRHPPVRDEFVFLTKRQRWNGYFALLIFVLTFIPIPIRTLGSVVQPPDIQRFDAPRDILPGAAPKGDDRFVPPLHRPVENENQGEEFKL